jgi:hypothetical protein
MTKPERTRLTVLLAILLVVGVISYFVTRDNSSGPALSSALGSYEPIAVENPSLRLDLLESLRKVEYTGRHRNIFSEIAPPPVLTPAEIQKRNEAMHPQVVSGPPPVPPVQVNLKFYGYVDDPRTGNRRAFFTNGDDIFIAGIGDTLENRLRVVRIGNDSVELEEISSQRHTTLAIEPDAATP